MIRFIHSFIHSFAILLYSIITTTIFIVTINITPKPTKYKIKMGYAKDKDVVGAHEYDKAKEKAGFVAGKHIHKKSKWWFQSKTTTRTTTPTPTAAVTNNNDIKEEVQK